MRSTTAQKRLGVSSRRRKESWQDWYKAWRPKMKDDHKYKEKSDELMCVYGKIAEI